MMIIAPWKDTRPMAMKCVFLTLAYKNRSRMNYFTIVSALYGFSMVRFNVVRVHAPKPWTTTIFIGERGPSSPAPTRRSKAILCPESLSVHLHSRVKIRKERIVKRASLPVSRRTFPGPLAARQPRWCCAPAGMGAAPATRPLARQRCGKAERACPREQHSTKT